ncbi:hypothetical protein EKH55_0559 [Sinorhizobium alkalisoli]|nr:hypothetical protein EKH55_0559 [Sinorhizobium alkalisoli]
MRHEGQGSPWSQRGKSEAMAICIALSDVDELEENAMIYTSSSIQRKCMATIS